MLPTELLRVRISSKMNQLKPVFYDYEKDPQLSLPSKIIRMYEDMATKKLSKADVDENLSKLESKSPDYKLVRAICHLLEQRCEYALADSAFSQGKNNSTIDPIYLRRKIFEESSRVGYPVTENERKSILQKVSLDHNLSINEMEVAMWNDLDKNKFLRKFESISPYQLVAWYNISILQTLLLNCAKLEFSVYGGYNWKKILRRVKQLGLMYFLHHESNLESDSNNKSKNDGKVICTVEGPLSLVRLTDRYGAAMARLIPSIIFTDIWSIDATILRKSMFGKKKSYNFRLSSNDSNIPIFDASKFHFQSKAGTESELSFDMYTSEDFDSNIEKKFMEKFLKFSTGWKLIREPDPLILSDGKAFIPDFLFEKHGIRVYLEIVGFWTKDYLQRKLEKIRDLSMKSGTSVGSDLLIAANIDNYISENGNKISIDSVFSRFVSKKNLIFYKKDEIPFGPLIKYLRDIDSEIIDRISINLHDTIAAEIHNVIRDTSNGVISLKGVSDIHKIPLESVLKIIKVLQSNNDSPKKVVTNRLKEFLLVDNYLISNKKIKTLLPELDRISKLQDAVRLLCDNNIPEECVTLLIPKMGYEIVWNGIDSNNAQIKRQIMDD